MVETKSSQKAMSVEEVGERFLDYYQRLGYEIIPGSSLLDDSVPMSFVMSAGMVQFERMSGKKRSGDYFALIQNCFRYFDLDQIGESNTHLSLFQMPGAFDFGPVDRQRTVNQIWDLLTRVYGLAQFVDCNIFWRREIDGQELPPDTETAKAWQAMGLPAEHIIGLGAESNFWSQTSQAVGLTTAENAAQNGGFLRPRPTEHGCGTTCRPGCSLWQVCGISQYIIYHASI